MIVNPMASSVTRRGLVVAQKKLGDRHELTVHETTRQHHATRLAHRAMREGADVVLTVGGDGTVNEAVNGLMGTDCGLAPLPGGSTNVFARAIGYPNDLELATDAVLATLEAYQPGESGPADRPAGFVKGSLGMANDRAFVFHVGAGFDAAVVHRVEARSPLKRLAGHPWFIASAIRTWGSPERRALSLRMEADDGREAGPLQMAVAMNVNPYTFLGNKPLDLAPEVDLTTALSVVALDSVALTDIGPAMKAALSSPTGIANSGGQHHWVDVEGITIRSDQPFPYQLDGEPVDPVTELRLTHRPAAVTFLLPAVRSAH